MQCLHGGMHERNGHQIESIFSRPAKRFFGARRSYPDWRMRSLHRLWQHANMVVVEEFAVEVDRFVGPRLAQDFRPLNHALGALLPACAKSQILDGLASFADAKVQSAIGENIDHAV